MKLSVLFYFTTFVSFFLYIYFYVLTLLRKCVSMWSGIHKVYKYDFFYVGKVECVVFFHVFFFIVFVHQKQYVCKDVFQFCR